MEDTGNDTPDECSLRNRNREPRFSSPTRVGEVKYPRLTSTIYLSSPTRVGEVRISVARDGGYLQLPHTCGGGGSASLERTWCPPTAPCPRREEGAVGGCSGMSSGASIRGTRDPEAVREFIQQLSGSGSGEAGRAPARVARASACYRGDPGKPFMPIDLRIFSFSEKGSFQRLIP